MTMDAKNAARGLAIGVLLASGLAGAAAAQDLEKGRALAEALCQRCHAIGEHDTGASEDAPPFREIAGRYPVWSLQEALAEGILVGHPDMPEFTLDTDEIDALLGYMDTLTLARARD